MELAPIVLFVYNRPEHTLKTLRALSENDLADKSELYIFADGPKPGADSQTLEDISRTREVLGQAQWCKEVHILERETNIGLANSVIDGVTQIVNKYGKVIVLEDDIVTSTGFLTYMNSILTEFQNNDKIYSVSGYMYPHNVDINGIYFYNIPLCWGWGTWKRAWECFIIDSKYLYEAIDRRNLWKDLNKFGNNDLREQLVNNVLGSLNTWFIKWHASILLKNGYCIFPSKSFVNNIGFDSTGEHCTTTDIFFNSKLETRVPLKITEFKESEVLRDIITEHYSRASGIRKNPSQPFRIKRFFVRIMRRILEKIYPDLLKLKELKRDSISEDLLFMDSIRGEYVKIYPPFNLRLSKIDDYTYIAENSNISYTTIGKFCSIGPNLMCGYGIHPIDKISTHPMFYSTLKQNTISLTKEDKIEERKFITIGNDVFIGANVTILDGVTIGDGAVVGAGSVVSKDIPPFAVAYGSPIQVRKYRFDSETISKLQSIKWWKFEESDLLLVEKYFDKVDEFINLFPK
ncbi:CatB-related O-acetyltransferase [Aegicerativicinus sediminis]|uniref:CatB-related O-acetyltransferase n=1 Tax=Aegicerativicinus sediminis TaxID=2893202 RepID=UPI001E374BAC|nr:CatB-related O-acetyltransferase [Aegicerativicinus sediminis]